jgi:hypothetical protein
MEKISRILSTEVEKYLGLKFVQIKADLIVVLI